MKRKKLSLNKLTLGRLSDAEKRKIVGGASSTMTGANGQCANPPKVTFKKSTIAAGCPPKETAKPLCDTIGPKVTCLP